jgi:hypothetical protein
VTQQQTWQRQFTYEPPVSLWRQPARLAAAIGAVAMVFGALLPWAIGVLPKAGPRQLGGLNAPGDGVFMIACAVGILVLLAIRGLAEARNPIGRVIPLFIVAAVAIVWLQDYGVARAEVDTWLGFGGTGSVGIGLWLIGAGIVLMGAGTTWLWRSGPLESD